MALTGIISAQHIQDDDHECKDAPEDREQIGRASNVHRHNTGNAARDN